MSLRSCVQENVRQMFAALGDLAVLAVFVKQSDETYNATTGAVSEDATELSVRLVVQDFQQNLIDGDRIKADDQVAYGAILDFGDVVPAVQDQIRFDNIVWQIFDVQQDVAQSYYRLHVRRA